MFDWVLWIRSNQFAHAHAIRVGGLEIVVDGGRLQAVSCDILDYTPSRAT